MESGLDTPEKNHILNCDRIRESRAASPFPFNFQETHSKTDAQSSPSSNGSFHERPYTREVAVRGAPSRVEELGGRPLDDLPPDDLVRRSGLEPREQPSGARRAFASTAQTRMK